MSDTDRIDALISDQSLTEILTELVNMTSPTGEEAPLATHIVTRLESYGLDAHVQTFDQQQANAFGVITGQGHGKTLLLYAPIDTLTSNSETEDLPWLGPELRDDMKASAYVMDGHVFGLGAHNPKGHGACILETARILQAMQPALAGNVFFGFGAGGMPTHSRRHIRPGSGHGRGCTHMIANIPKVDGAIIAKSGSSVTWEEVGFIWFDVSVGGIHNYVGARHLMPYSNAIANASKLILKLEDWFESYTQAHATELCRPQGAISFMESGWERMPAFTPAAARFLIDLRFTPQQTADAVEAEFASVLETFCKALHIKAHYKRIQTIQASHTSPTDPVIETTIRVWENLHNRTHEPFTHMSGATDANILRAHGIPTARIGLPKAKRTPIDFALGMNCAAISDMRHLTKLLVMSAIRYCSESPCHG